MGMPKIILKGKVMPNDIPMYKAGFTSGMAWRNTAGTAIMIIFYSLQASSD